MYHECTLRKPDTQLCVFLSSLSLRIIVGKLTSYCQIFFNMNVAITLYIDLVVQRMKMLNQLYRMSSYCGFGVERQCTVNLGSRLGYIEAIG
jgi:hypothetical protein